MSDQHPMTRRRFLGTSGAAAAAAAGFPYVLTGSALGSPDKRPANSRLTLGFIGVGGMGGGHLGAFIGKKQTQVLAVCDVDQSRRDAAAKRVGPDCKTYKDFRELLDRDDIDAVVIATPDHWHALVAIAACQAGKDIYCEKPLTLTIQEGRALTDTVRRYGRVFQTGSQQRSADNFRFACELVRNGRIGKLQTVRTGVGGGPTCGPEPPAPVPPTLDWDFWLGPAPHAPYTPKRCHFTFRWFYDYSGGNVTDWGAHHNDIAQWGMGMSHTGPVYIDGKGRFPESGLYNTVIDFDVVYQYANGLTNIFSSKNRHGIRFEGTDGWVHVDRGVLEADPPELLQEKISPGEIHLYESHSHHDDWLQCIETRQRPICDVEIGFRSVTVCHLANISMRLGRPIRWDPDKEQILGDDEAARWVSKPMRAPWHL